MNVRAIIMLIEIKKNCKVCFQRNKKGKRYQTTYYHDIYPDKHEDASW